MSVKTISLSLVYANGSTVTDYSNLQFAFFAQPLPVNFTGPEVTGSGVNITGGAFEITLHTALNIGDTGFLVLTNTTGLTTQSPSAIVFAGPVLINNGDRMTTLARNAYSFNTLSEFNSFGGAVVYGEGPVWIAAQQYWSDGSTINLVGGGAGGADPQNVATVSSTNSAAANTGIIQAALNMGGDVYIAGDGVIQVNATLLLKSNSTINLDKKIVLRAVGSTPFCIFKNSMWAETGRTLTSVSAVQISAMKMIRCTATYTVTPNVVVGDFILVKGDTSLIYNGVWEVETVIGNNVTWLMSLGGGTAPSAAVPHSLDGLSATKSNSAISIVGPGQLDGYFIAGGKVMANSYEDHAILFNNCGDPIVRDITFVDFRKYCICAANVVKPELINTTGVRTDSDGIHLYGPCWRPIVDGLFGTFGDDGVIFQTFEAPGYTQYMPPGSGGSFFSGASVRNAKAMYNGNSGLVVLYPAGGVSTTDDGYRMYGQFNIENIGHEMPNTSSPMMPQHAVAIGNGYVNSPGGIDSLVIREVYGDILISNSASAKTISINSVDINNHTCASSGEDGLIVLDYVSISRISINGVTAYNPTGHNNNYISAKSTNVNVKQVNVSNCSFLQIGGSGSLTAIGNYGSATSGPVGGSFGQVNFNNLLLSANTYVLNSNNNSFTAAPNIFVDKLKAEGSNAISVGGTCTANITVNDSVSAGTLFNLYGTGVITVSGNNISCPAAMLANTQTNVTLKNVKSSANVIRSVPASGATVTINNKYGYQRQLIAPAGTLAALTIAFPANPSDGEIVEIYITQSISALTITGGTVSGVPSGSAITAGFSRILTYNIASNIWF